MAQTSEAKRIGHSKTKRSTVDLKAICPMANTRRFSVLEYCASDPHMDDQPSITWWEGDRDGDFEARLEWVIGNHRQKAFEIPGVPFKFMIVNGEIYYRKNVETVY